ncbi:MAG: glycine cleavage system protein GcvH [Chloroflexi bacterium]|nr:glycine cleavage system protein GcvH [Chloroflexota bacterium]
MASPSELKYTKDHEWLKVDGGTGIVGITDYAQHSLGDVVYVDAGAAGKQVEAAKPFGVVESVKAASDLFSPVTGEIVEVNAALADKPELVNSDPYGAAWMLKVKLANPGEVASLLSAADYDAYIATL